MCVQSFDGSRGFAIRMTYRISLRSSSLWEPRHPLLKVVEVNWFPRKDVTLLAPNRTVWARDKHLTAQLHVPRIMASDLLK